ncbi:MAG: hypothetical protein FWD28_05510 [Treponema sp.]|nr:hypothetical protein [Treponema sp.]
MKIKISIFAFLILIALLLLFSKNAVSEEYNSNFTVNYSGEFFYCGEDIIITISSNTEINGSAVIRAELYWIRFPESRELIKISGMEFEMRQKNIKINIPTDYDWGDDVNSPFIDKSDEVFCLKIYFNDILISQSNEIWIGCSSVW